jgi:tetratricopeptide (TPR) repeat protein
MVYGLDSVLNHYGEALTTLEQTATRQSRWRSQNHIRSKLSQPTIKQKQEQLTGIILKVLRSRDTVQATLAATPRVSTEALLRLMRLDDRLRNQASLIAEAVPLADWRATIRPDAEAWWWSLEAPEHRLDQFDWLWTMLSIIFLTISVSLIAATSARFLSGGPDVLGALAIVAQSVLALLTAGTLTESGRKAIEHIFSQLNRFGLKQYLWQEAKLVLSALLLVSLLIFWSQLPPISNFFNNRGLDRYEDGELANAQSDFERAVSLDPNNLSAHYNLGRLYEGVQELDKARTSYLIAAQGDYAPGFNDLGRLALQADQLPEAASFLQRGLELTHELPEGDERNHTSYALLKNLGWVRLEQERYSKAEEELRKAIALDHTFPYPPASAHCLLAQVLEKKTPPENALPEWEFCQSYLVVRSPEEDTWFHLAQQRLNQQGEP